MIRALKTALLAGAMLAGSAQAASLTPGAYWSTFNFGDTNSSIVDSATGDLSYDFTLTGWTYLDVTDAFVIGDQFTIYNSAALVGTTGPFDTTGATTSDPDVAFAGTAYSHARWLLGAGNYSINGIASTSCCGGGGGFIRLAAVPEPATWALMIAGFGMVGGAMRRRTFATA